MRRRLWALRHTSGDGEETISDTEQTIEGKNYL